MNHSDEEIEKHKQRASDLLKKTQIELDPVYNEYKTDFYTRLEEYDTTEDKLKFILYDLKAFREAKITSASSYHKTYSPEVRINQRNFHIEILDYLIELLTNHYDNLIEISKIEKLDVFKNAEYDKIKWKGTPAEFGFIFSELANKGFIEYPLYNGEINPTGLAKNLFSKFDLDTSEAYVVKQVINGSNALSLTKRNKFTFPEQKDLS